MKPISCLFCVGIMMVGIRSSYADDIRRHVQVTVLSSHGKVVYQVAGATVNERNVLEALDKQARVVGINADVDVILDASIPFSAMFDITGMVGKIGFNNVSCYVMDSHRRTMVQMLRGEGNIPVPTELSKQGLGPR